MKFDSKLDEQEASFLTLIDPGIVLIEIIAFVRSASVNARGSFRELD